MLLEHIVIGLSLIVILICAGIEIVRLRRELADLRTRIAEIAPEHDVYGDTTTFG